jgi:hypothetical protein
VFHRRLKRFGRPKKAFQGRTQSMEARLLRAALLVAAVMSLGASRPYSSVRSAHFIVSAPTPQLAEEICQAAEQFRRDLAVEWLGRELPEWQGPCPIKADVAPNLGAGGATSFVFHGGAPSQWTMQIQGSRERVLDSVLPHEITHTIFATHFGRPLPRWADEGACTTVEHTSEKAKQDHFLIQFLTPDARGNTRGIPFNRMFQMKEYPPDILPLYSQGYSLARFFIEQGGKPKFVQYVGEGMQTNNWPATTRKYYGFGSLSDLQLTWVEWVRKGSPSLPNGMVPENLLVSSQAAPAPEAGSRNMSNTQMASLTQQPRSRIPDGPRSSWQTVQEQNARAFAQADQFGAPPVPASFARPAVTPAEGQAADHRSATRPVSDGWYAKRRDQAQAAMGAAAGDSPAVLAVPSSVASPSPGTDGQVNGSAPQQQPQEVANVPPRRAPIQAEPLVKPQTPNAANNSRVLMEWTRPADEPYRSADDLTGVAGNRSRTLLR